MSVSPLAHRDGGAGNWPRRGSAPYGLVVHTPGSTAIAKARKLGIPPLEYLVAHYNERGRFGPHYVCDLDGTLVQLEDDDEVTWHVGWTTIMTRLYRTGRWRRVASAATVEAWDERWPGRRSPLELLPGDTPNACMLGIEVIPIVAPSEYEPLVPGMRYTAMQHESVRGLVRDLARRHRWPRAELRARVLGHEDLAPLPWPANPSGRADAGGGWDPGALRASPRWDWEWILR